MPLSEPESPLCARARHWISLQADGELADLERALLEAHLSSCPHCVEFGIDVSAITGDLRLAPLEQLSRPIVLPPHRHRIGALQMVLAGAAFAALVLLASLGILGFGPSHDSNQPATNPSTTVQGFSSDFETHILRSLLHPNAIDRDRGPF
jgi:anti-sigma factor RsiW